MDEQNLSLPYRLAEQFSELTNRCIFLTGKAGTGKTTFLKHLREVTPKNIAVVAPTGVAAINAGGMTIHSFFQLPIRTIVPTPQSYKQMFAEQRMMQRKRQMLYHLELLVIDEISMVRADLLDAIDAVLRHYKFRRDLPFGGVQVVMIGDLMQLQPVVHGVEEKEQMAQYYNGPYFFHSNVMQQLQPVYIELDHVFRQQNEQFVQLLNEVRENRLSVQGQAMLASRYIPQYVNTDDDFHITLTTHNKQADELNHQHLDALKGRLYTFTAEVEDNFPESSYPTELQLRLRVGARVMFIRNDEMKPRRFYNGKLGIVKAVDTSEDIILVECEDGDIEVQPMMWQNIRYREEPESGKITEDVLGTFTQYPLRLAWAITIHKSQGLTFDRVIIDAARSFAAGQVYVALSRCRTLEGIVLSTPLQNVRLGSDRLVLDYIASQPDIEQTNQNLGQAQKEYRLQLFAELYSVATSLSLTEQILRHVAKCVSFTMQTLPFLDNVSDELKVLAPVGESFRRQLTQIIFSEEDKTELLQQRIAAASNYFIPRVQQIADNISNHPCRSKNKADVADFDSMIADLFLILSQKVAIMQAVAKEADIEVYLQAKNRFVVPKMAVQTAFGSAVTKKENEKKKTLGGKDKKPKAAADTNATPKSADNADNAYKPWTKEDDQTLTSLSRAKFSLDELAEVFRRKKSAIVARLKKLGLA